MDFMGRRLLVKTGGVNGCGCPQRARRLHRLRCEPSQKGGFSVALHWQRVSVDLTATSNFRGWIPEPLCEPSQNGLWLVLPQAHQK